MKDLTLVVAGDEHARARIAEMLRRHGHRAVVASTGEAGEEAFRAYEPSLVVIDTELPDKDAMEVCRNIRSHTQAPMLITSRLRSRYLEAEALMNGANDFLPRPFSADVLLGHVEDLLEGNLLDGTAPNTFELGSLLLERDSKTVTVDGIEVTLTEREYTLLSLLMEHPRRVLSRKELLHRIWGDAYDPKVLDVALSRLRSKILSVGGPLIGQPVPGIGYRLGDIS